MEKSGVFVDIKDRFTGQVITSVESMGLIPDFPLFGANFHGMNLTNADFSGMNLEYANFDRTNLSRADFSEAKLMNASFQEANLLQTVLRRADAHSANFYDARFIGTDLYQTNMVLANFLDATFVNVNLNSVKEFQYAVGNNVNIYTMQFGGDHVVIWEDRIAVNDNEQSLESFLTGPVFMEAPWAPIFLDAVEKAREAKKNVE